jgi:uncharacterized protein (DUF488 family)
MVCLSVAIAGHDGPMRALPETALVTVGYEGRTAEELVSAVAEAGVDVLADVRLTPLSRKPGLSKRRLAAALAGAGIEYVHLPALGNPQDNREAFRRGDPASRARFQGLLGTPPAQSALAELGSRAQHERVALLCFERDADCCHRGLVAEYLLSHDPRLAVRHL